jgi:hypothetical protein
MSTMLTAMVALAGCFRPSLGDQPFRCGDGDACPPGYGCRAGVCLRDGAEPPGPDAGPGDASQGSNGLADAAAPDDAPLADAGPDARAPDDAPDDARPDASLPDAAAADALPADARPADAPPPDAGSRCTAGDIDRFVASLPLWFVAQYPKSLCVPETSTTQGLVTVTACAESCGDGVGCLMQIVHYDAGYVASNAAFSSLADASLAVDLSFSLDGLALGSCTLTVTVTDAVYQATVTIAADGSTLGASVADAAASGVVPALAGCNGLGPVVVAVLDAYEPDLLSTLASLLATEASSTLEQDRAICPM